MNLIELPDLNYIPSGYRELNIFAKQLEERIDNVYFFVVEDKAEYQELEEDQRYLLLDNLQEAQRRLNVIKTILKGHLLFSS